jgi:hypothetical protein
MRMHHGEASAASEKAKAPGSTTDRPKRAIKRVRREGDSNGDAAHYTPAPASAAPIIVPKAPAMRNRSTKLKPKSQPKQKARPGASVAPRSARSSTATLADVWVSAPILPVRYEPGQPPHPFHTVTGPDWLPPQDAVPSFVPPYTGHFSSDDEDEDEADSFREMLLQLEAIRTLREYREIDRDPFSSSSLKSIQRLIVLNKLCNIVSQL